MCRLFNEHLLHFFYLQEMVQAKDPPSHYLSKLRTYLDPKASRSHRVSQALTNCTICSSSQTPNSIVVNCITLLCTCVCVCACILDLTLTLPQLFDKS